MFAVGGSIEGCLCSYATLNAYSRVYYVVAICQAWDGVKRGCRVAVWGGSTTEGVGVDNASTFNIMGMDKESTTTHIETYDE